MLPELPAPSVYTIADLEIRAPQYGHAGGGRGHGYSTGAPGSGGGLEVEGSGADARGDEVDEGEREVESEGTTGSHLALA